MKYANGLLFGIDDDDGKAIGGQHCEKNARSASNEAVSREIVAGTFRDAVDNVGVNLSARDQRPIFR
jgi:hypothetical protein